IPEGPGNWAYISSGTWSIAGVPSERSLRTHDAFTRGFTNLGAASGGILFHRGIPGMWLLRQCMKMWDQTRPWNLTALIEEARRLPAPDHRLDLNDPALLTPGDMPSRINAQRKQRALAPLPHGCDAAPEYANLIFHSLAVRYGLLIDEIEQMTGRRPHDICVVGGGSQNEYLNALTEQSTGLSVHRYSP